MVIAAGLLAPAVIPSVAVGVPIISGITGVGISTILSQALQPRQKFPKISPGELLGAGLQIQALSERGLVPVTTVDPFTGGLTISTQDQSEVLGGILADRELRRQLAPTEAEKAEIRELRDIIIRARAGEIPGPQDIRPGGAQPTVPAIAAIAPNVVTTPTGRPAAGGTVTRGMNLVSKRLSGPCAGALTGAQRIACGRGGIA